MFCLYVCARRSLHRHEASRSKSVGASSPLRCTVSVLCGAALAQALYRHATLHVRAARLDLIGRFSRDGWQSACDSCGPQSQLGSGRLGFFVEGGLFERQWSHLGAPTLAAR